MDSKGGRERRRERHRCEGSEISLHTSKALWLPISCDNLGSGRNVQRSQKGIEKTNSEWTGSISSLIRIQTSIRALKRRLLVVGARKRLVVRNSILNWLVSLTGSKSRAYGLIMAYYADWRAAGSRAMRIQNLEPAIWIKYLEIRY